jgi:tripartite-type tricarboxylate transporter receptor subunit TctC
VPLLPAVPTFRELGMPLEAANWFALLGPARIPPAASARIADAAAEALRSSAAQEVFRTQGILPVAMPPDETRAFMAADRERWTTVVRGLDLRLD